MKRNRFTRWFKWHFGTRRKQCMHCYKTYYYTKKVTVIGQMTGAEYEESICPHCANRAYFIEV
jgi:hypothetical protein